MNLKVEIENDRIYVDNVTVGNIQYQDGKIQFSERLLKKGIVKEVSHKIISTYYYDLIKQIESYFNLDNWKRYKYDL